MEQATEFRVPRSRVYETHKALRQAIWEALEPVLFHSPAAGEAARRDLEEQFARIVGQRFACAVHSGTVGLFLVLRACGVGPGDEVITVGNSDISTTAAISHCGAVPVLCDVQASDYTMDPDLVEPLITERTKALLPVDLYGHPADVQRLREIADRHGLCIVEDAALAAGARDHGRPVGAFADAAVFSFAPFKPLGSVGNGGMVTTDNPEIAQRLRLLCGYGHLPDVKAPEPGHQRHLAEGYNVPLDPLQAALLSVKIALLPEWTAKRRAIAAAYEERLRSLDLALPAFRPESEPTFRSYTVRVRDQVRVYQGLRRAGVEAVLHYVPPVYRQPVYPQGLPGSDRLPVTERLAREIVCLPVSPELTLDDVEYVVEVLRNLL
ncbi:MAG: DegT/DnrJ/EryC1/StrS family aminotransferase [Anaerolineae bacterium]